MILIAACAASEDVAVHWTHPFVQLISYIIYVAKEKKVTHSAEIVITSFG